MAASAFFNNSLGVVPSLGDTAMPMLAVATSDLCSRLKGSRKRVMRFEAMG